MIYAICLRYVENVSEVKSNIYILLFSDIFVYIFFSRLLSSITEPTQLQGEGGEPPIDEENQPPSLVPCEDGCDQDKVEQGGTKRVCFKVNEEDQEDSGHDTMSYRDSYR